MSSNLEKKQQGAECQHRYIRQVKTNQDVIDLYQCDDCGQRFTTAQPSQSDSAEKQEQFEAGYSAGSAMAWRSLLAECLINLSDDERDQHSWLKERTDCIVLLRSLCAEFGDNDWPDDLYLSDIIDNHLADHLRADNLEVMALLNEKCWRWKITADKNLQQEIHISGEIDQTGDEFLISGETLADALAQVAQKFSR